MVCKLKINLSINALAAIVILLSAVSCQDRIKPLRNGSLTQVPIINPSIKSKDLSEVKSGSSAGTLTHVYGGDEDGFTIEEYVSDIDDFIPATKGTEIIQTDPSSGNFNDSGRQFQVMAFLDSLKASGDYDHKNEFNLVTECNGSKKWNWVLPAGEKAPCWRTSTDYSIWSYWPISANGRSSIDESSVADWNDRASSTSKLDYNSLTFTHTVPNSLEDQEDLLFAYNYEHRDFKTDAQGNYPIDPITKKPIFELVDGQASTYDVKFYHALAAVKFELGEGMSGIDVKSITLCYTSTDAEDNITIQSGGLATFGKCDVSGSGSSTGIVSYSWKDRGNFKPLYYEFGSDQSVAGGYAKSGKGVLFMIPQTASNVSIIVEFSKNNSETYMTRIQNIPSVNWEPGKYYLYRLSGEIHVPGELLAGKVNLSVEHFATAQAQNLWSTHFTQKGIKKVGMIVDGYAWGGNQSGVLDLFVSNGTPVPTVPTSHQFQYNFLDTDVPSNPNVGTVYHFGLTTGTETYDTHYSYTTSTSKTATRYFVFDVENVVDTSGKFNIQMYTTSTNNGAKFTAQVRCLMILEVKNAKLPANWKESVAPDGLE